MNLSGIYSPLYDRRKEIKPGMKAVYTDVCNWIEFEITETDGVEFTATEIETGETETRTYENLQHGWQLSLEDSDFLDAIKKEA